jgi:hypothetical protein
MTTDHEALFKIANICGRPTTSYASADVQLKEQSKKLADIFLVVKEQFSKKD